MVQNETHYYFLAQSMKNDTLMVELLKSQADSLVVVKSQSLDSLPSDNLYLKIEARGSTYAFFYGIHPDDWQLLEENVDSKFLSTQEAGGFVGTFYALYATSNGQPSGSKVYFDWFEYEGADKIYNYSE